jgi:surface antigen
MKSTGLKKLMCAIITAGILFGTSTEVRAEEWEEPVWTEDTGWYEPSYTNPYYGGWSNCTWSAWQIALEQTGIALPEFGSAGSWLYNAAAMGYWTGSQPAAGSIIVWSHHVGYVSAVSEDGSMIYVMEGGYCGGYHEGWFPAYFPRSSQALLGYIYLY